MVPKLWSKSLVTIKTDANIKRDMKSLAKPKHSTDLSIEIIIKSSQILSLSALDNN